MKSVRIAAAMVLIAALLVAPARATEPFAAVPVKVFGSPFTTSHSARNMGMGGAGVADPSTPANAVFNPANILGDDGVSTLYGNYRHYDLFDVHDAAVAGVKTWSGSGIRGAVAVRQLFHDYDAVIERTVFLPEGTGSTFEQKEWGTGVALGLGVPVGGVAVSLGVSTERVEMELAQSKVVAWAFDVGARVSVQAVDPRRGNRLETHLAAAVLNAGNGFDFDGHNAPSPRQVRFGAGARFTSGYAVPMPFDARDASVVTAAVDVDVVPDDPRNEDVTALAGIELGFLETIYVRAGAGGDVVEQSSGVSYGAGLAAHTGPLCLRADIATYPARSIFTDDETIWSVALEYRP